MFQRAVWLNPEFCALVKLDFVPNSNGGDFTALGGKRTVVAFSLSLMWAPKDTAQPIASLSHFVSPSL